MRATAIVTAAVLASSATAAPTPGLISSILGLLTNDINKLLSSLGIHLHTDGANHGATVPFHNHHDINWGKGVNGGNFINWKTFKANGANLGGWLEKEQTHDPIWWSEFLKTITDYAINKYGMHIIVGLHSLPGGVNNLDIGEALFHQAWFQNSTNLDYSFQAVDGVLNFIKQSGHVNAFTIAPINEASDNFAGFGSAAGLTINGTNWINTYFSGVLKKIAKLLGTSSTTHLKTLSSILTSTTSPPLAHTPATSTLPCAAKAQYIAQETKFPVFVGEWSLQAMYNNTLDTRKTIFDTQRYAWNKYLAGGAFWNGVSYATAKVDGEGTQREYWSYIDLINQGVITKVTNESYC
ncbi:unnamed protein product [Alternaria alternata]